MLHAFGEIRLDSSHGRPEGEGLAVQLGVGIIRRHPIWAWKAEMKLAAWGRGGEVCAAGVSTAEGGSKLAQDTLGGLVQLAPPGLMCGES